MTSTMNRKSRDRSRASFNQSRRLSLFGQPSKQNDDEQQQMQIASPPRGSSLSKSASLNQSVSMTPLSKLQLSNSGWRPALTLSSVRTLRGMSGPGGSGSAAGLLRGREENLRVAGERNTFPPDPSSVVFPTRESVSTAQVDDISDAVSLSVHDGANTSLSSSAITLSPSVSTSSFKRAKRSLKMRVAVTLSGIFVPKPKLKRKGGGGGALDGVDGIYCERELADRAARKGRFLNGALSRGRKTIDADSEGQEIRYSYISRSPSPPSPEIRPPSGLGNINPNADMSDMGGMGFRDGYSFSASGTNLSRGAVPSQSPYDESKLSPTRAMFPHRPLTSPDSAQSFSRTDQTPTPTPSHATSACSSPITNRPSLDSLSDIFYSPPPPLATMLAKNELSCSTSLPPPTVHPLNASDSNLASMRRPNSHGKPLPLIPVETLNIIFPPSPALSPPLSKSLAARVLGPRSSFTSKSLQVVLPYLPRSSLASLACVSRSFCRTVRPALYAAISFDELRPNSRKRCLLTLASKREIAKLVESFSWNALVVLEDDDIGEDDYSLSDEGDQQDGDSKPDLLARAISNLIFLKSLTLALSKNTHKLLTRVRSQLTSFSSTGLSSTACALFLSTWLPTQPSLTHLSLPDVFCFPLASTPTSPLSLSSSTSSASSKSSSSVALVPRTVPNLMSFSGTTSLASILIPSRPVNRVELHVSQTLYDGLRPNEVMRCLVQSRESLKELRLRVTGKVDARTIGKVVSSAGSQLGSGIMLLGITGWEGEPKDLYAQVAPSLTLFGALQTVDLSSEASITETTDQINVTALERAESTTPTMLSKFSLISNALTPSANSSVSSLLSDSSSPRSSIASSLDLDLDDLSFAFDFPLPPTTDTAPICADVDDSMDSCSRTVRRISPYSVAHALADLDAELNSPAAAEERRKRAESERERKEKEAELESGLAAQWLQRCPTLRRIKWSSGNSWVRPTTVPERQASPKKSATC